MSPWITFDQSSPSMKSNGAYDFLHKPSLKIAAQHYLGNGASDEYNTPLQAPPAWWQGLPSQNTLITCGSFEVFLDDVREFAKKI